ncbi:Putative olfactory receptor 10D4 [Lemmus lemmus]
MGNHTMVTEFTLLGIPETAGLEKVLLLLFSALYACALLGNLLILTAVISSQRLHTPMYFFLGNLSIFDLGFCSTTAPKMLSYLSGRGRGISFQGCVVQHFFYHCLGCTLCFLYTVMAYDRFVAICFPLRYTVIMNHRTWMSGCVHSVILTSLTFQLPYCGPSKVDYYFCDMPAVLLLACEDPSLVQKVGFTNVGLLSLICFSLIVVSYTRIGISISKIRSKEGRQKAFSTCSAHLTAIVCVYGPVIIIYLQPNPSPLLSPSPSPLLGAIIQILNNLVTPTLNPLIYSLRNKDVKSALRNIFLKRNLSLENK